MLNPGILDRMAIAFNAALNPGWGLLSADVLWLLGVMSTLYLAGMLTFAMTGMLDVVPKICLMLAKYTAFVWVLSNFHTLSDLLINVHAGLGLILSQSSMTAAEFALPGRILWQGQDLLWPLIDHVNSLSWLDYAKNFFAIQFMTAAMWLSWVAFFLLALHMFYVQVTCKLAVLLNFPKIAFGIFSGTAFLAHEGLQAILQQCLRLATVALLVGVSSPWLRWLAFPAQEKPGYWSALALVAGSWTILTLSWAGPRALQAHGGALVGAAAGAMFGMVRGVSWLRRAVR